LKDPRQIFIDDLQKTQMVDQQGQQYTGARIQITVCPRFR
jgi:hypothetical protein